MEEDYIRDNHNEINIEDDQDDENEDLLHYKGKYFDDDQDEKYYEAGAHFAYTDLYYRLEKLATKLSPDRIIAPADNFDNLDSIKTKRIFNGINNIQSSRNTNNNINAMNLSSKNFTKDFKLRDKINFNMNTLLKTKDFIIDKSSGAKDLNTININSPVVIFKKVNPVIKANIVSNKATGKKILAIRASDKKINNSKANNINNSKSLTTKTNLVIMNNSNLLLKNAAIYKEHKSPNREKDDRESDIEKMSQTNTIIMNELNKMVINKSRNISNTKAQEITKKTSANNVFSVASPVPNKNNLIENNFKTISSNKSRNTNRTLPDKTEMSNNKNHNTTDNKALFVNTGISDNLLGNKYIASTIKSDMAKNDSKGFLTKKKVIAEPKKPSNNFNQANTKNIPQFLTKNTLNLATNNILHKKPIEAINSKTKKVPEKNLGKETYTKLLVSINKTNKTLNKANIKYLLLTDSAIKKDSSVKKNKENSKNETIETRNNFSPNPKLNTNNLISSTNLSQKNENFSSNNKTILNTNTNTNNYNSSISNIFY